MTRSLILLLPVLLGACASGPRFSETGGELVASETGKVNIVLLRTKEHLLFGGRQAPVYLDENEAVALARGEFSTHKLDAPPTSISTHVWDTPGECRLPLELERGHTYYFEISPRREGYLETVFFNMKWAAKTVATGALPTDLLYVNHNSVSCKGVFQLQPLSEQDALGKLAPLHLRR